MEWMGGMYPMKIVSTERGTGASWGVQLPFCNRSTWLFLLAIAAPMFVVAQDLVSSHPSTPSAAGTEMLATYCVSCHNPSDASGGLDLTSRKGALRGGESGAALLVGMPLDSLFWKRVAEGEMPPDEPLPDEARKILLDWLSDGAEWPEAGIDRFAVSTKKRAGRDWWSFQPLHPVSIPESLSENGANPLEGAGGGQTPYRKGSEIPEPTWAENPIDHFILAQLNTQGLSSAPRAAPRELVRRLSFALHGLPPENSDIALFERDPSPMAWTRLVDRYLGSHEYGTRWATPWMDIARFGETHGFEYNEPRAGTWYYRDWVIGALNEDLPYDQFVALQIAADSFHGATAEAFAAIGFLVAGPHNTVVGRSESMQLSAREQEIEEMVATLGQAFLGITIQCARCHDHKYDPITTEEYYRVAAALRGVRHGERTAAPELSTDARSGLESQLRQLRRQLRETYRARGVSVSKSANRLVRSIPALYNERGLNYRLSFDLSPTVWADSSQATTDRDAVLIRVMRLDQTSLLEQAIPSGDWIAAGSRQNFKKQQIEYVGDGSGELLLELSSEEHEGRFAGAIDNIVCTDDRGETLWTDDFSPIQVAEAPGAQAGTGLRVHCRLSMRDWQSSGFNSVHTVEIEPGNHALQIFGGLEDSLPSSSNSQEATLKSAIDKIEQDLVAVRLFTILSSEPGRSMIYHRGDVRSPGNEVSSGGIAAIAPGRADFLLPLEATDLQRREALARWITVDANALLCRVIVNRVWHHHFGSGLVEKTSDLGFSGGVPSHPELLEWLAHWFSSNGYSLKKLHRLILTSATWQQSSRISDPIMVRAAMTRDRTNRFLWRQNSRRLDAESIRDAMLFVAGALRSERGGPGYRDVSIDQIGAAHYYEPNEQVDEACFRRSIYRWHVRGERESILEAFDCPDPSATTPVRNMTTTPLQALSLWNSRFSLEMSRRVALRARSLSDSSHVDDHLRRLWYLVLQRAPDAEEIALGRDLASFHGLESVARVLLNSSEFLVVD